MKHLHFRCCLSLNIFCARARAVHVCNVEVQACVQAGWRAGSSSLVFMQVPVYSVVSGRWHLIVVTACLPCCPACLAWQHGPACVDATTTPARCLQQRAAAPACRARDCTAAATPRAAAVRTFLPARAPARAWRNWEIGRVESSSLPAGRFATWRQAFRSTAYLRTRVAPARWAGALPTYQR